MSVNFLAMVGYRMNAPEADPRRKNTTLPKTPAILIAIVLCGLALEYPVFAQATGQQPAFAQASQSQPNQSQTSVPPAVSPVPTPALAPDQLPQPPAPSNPAQSVNGEAPVAMSPGEGAQVRTGSKLGEIQDLVGRLTALLGDHRVPEMEQLLLDSDESAPGTPNKLTPTQSQFFRGVIANRENKPQDSIQLLEPLVKQLDSPEASSAMAGLGGEEKLLRRTLAEDYLRAGDWAKAAASFHELEAKLSASLTPEERDEMELPIKLLPLIAGNPPMTVEPGEAFTLPYDRDALGLTDIPVFVDAQSHDWMLDPTAPFNLICRSTAKDVGLKLSEQSALVHTITGRPMQVHATIIPRLTVGTITYRNMTAFVFEDADYYFPASKYLVRGVLGYPAVSALGRITITANARVEIEPGQKGDRLTRGARFFLDGDRVLAALGKPGNERMFVLDAAGQQTYLSSRYLAEHSDDFAGKKLQLLNVPGSARKPPSPAYVVDSVKLLVGETPVSFHYLQVLSEPIGSSSVDDTYGTLGMDALDELKSYTFDYRTMRFGVQTQ